MNKLRSRSFPHLFIEEIDIDMKILPIFFFPSHCSSFSCDLNSMCFLIASVLHVLCSSLASGLNDWRQVWVQQQLTPSFLQVFFKATSSTYMYVAL